jgi:hypothetical protein
MTLAMGSRNNHNNMPQRKEELPAGGGGERSGVRTDKDFGQLLVAVSMWSKIHTAHNRGAHLLDEEGSASCKTQHKKCQDLRKEAKASDSPAFEDFLRRAHSRSALHCRCSVAVKRGAGGIEQRIRLW